MLECYELWNTAAEVIKLCWIAAVNNLSNEVFLIITLFIHFFYLSEYIHVSSTQPPICLRDSVAS